MLLAVGMVVLMYLLPTLAVLGVTTDTDTVSMGFYGYVAERVRQQQCGVGPELPARSHVCAGVHVCFRAADAPSESGNCTTGLG